MLRQKLEEIFDPLFARRLVLLLSMLIFFHAYAAGFECGKAKGGVEKLICSDAQLSRSDVQLNIAYRISLKSTINRTESIADQRKWIVETRDRCADKRCLSRVYKERIARIESEIKRKGVPCEISEAQLIADWRSVADGYFEEFSIISMEGERQFVSWLHHRPAYIGTWKFKDCVLHLANDHDKAQDEDYEVIGLAGDVLYLKSAGMGESSLYRKIKE